MTRIKQLFFELVQTALGNRTRLSETPSGEEWDELYEMAIEQAIAGVLQAGLEQLPPEQRPYQDLLLEWIGSALIIKEQNKLMNKRCLELLGQLEEIGLQASILKGQGIARLYGCLGKMRQPGDIDVYVDSKREEALNVAKNMGLNVESWDYKHAHLEIWEDTEVELHYRVEVMFNLFKNRKLQKWFEAQEDEIFRTSKDSENSNRYVRGMVTPAVGFNVFYILLHIYRHFFTEGVGLRQIMDYYFVLRQNNVLKQNNIRTDYNATEDTEKYCKVVKEFGMERFAKGLMWVMLEVMAMPREWMLWKPDEKEGRYILEQVMAGGNFGHYGDHQRYNTGRLGYVKSLCHHSLHLMRHYPNEAIWVPVWIVWHKLWKICHS